MPLGLHATNTAAKAAENFVVGASLVVAWMVAKRWTGAAGNVASTAWTAMLVVVLKEAAEVWIEAGTAAVSDAFAGAAGCVVAVIVWERLLGRREHA